MWTSSQRIVQCIELKRKNDSLKRAEKKQVIFSLVTRKVSEQWPQVTRHIPGIDGTGGVTGLGAKFIIRLQFGRGHAMRCDELLHISKQLHGHRTYFLPGGAFRIG